MDHEEHVDLLRRARAAGISLMVATDAFQYIDMTLREIAEEWGKDEIDLLAALDKAFPVDNSPCPFRDFTEETLKKHARMEGEPFGQYMDRVLAKGRPDGTDPS